MVPVVADRDKIVQVVTNLLSNAAKFTAAGGRVDVRTLRENGHAIVEVRDTGIGIDSDQIDAVFEKFRQGGDPLTAKPEGTGLGLPISREIVERHGGSLTVRGEPGWGSCFQISLPLARPDGAEWKPEPDALAPDATAVMPLSETTAAMGHDVKIV
jgi:signal transduction histidine kinase